MRTRIQASGFLPVHRSIGLALLWMLLIALPGGLPAQGASTSPSSASGVAILHPADSAKILPSAVFFRGQSANVQTRNSGGVKYEDGMLVLSALVDNSGYSSGLEERYQGYFITEVPLHIQGHTLQPGAYGVGFLKSSQFVVMDLGGHDLFTISSGHDTELKRAIPFQILADSAAGHYRLYFGRNYVVFARAAGK